MSSIGIDQIQELRASTGAGIMDCKNALTESDGDQLKAQQILRDQGLEIAAKKASRTADQGVVEAYIHSGGRIGAIVELNCETDFVARTDDFRTLAHDLAMQVAAMNPHVLSSDPDGADSIPHDSNKALLSQSFIKDQSKTIQDLLTETTARTGEKIAIRRFFRFELGEE